MSFTPSIINKKIFITFGAGNQNYYDAVDRLTEQASNLNIFDNIIGYTDKDLKNDTVFWNEHSQFILNNKRGYGYWIWKPYLIMKTLEKMNENDILIYSDCGCEIDYKNRDKFDHIFTIIKTDLIIGTYTDHDEKKHNKMDLLLYLGMNNNKYLTLQRQSGLLCILNCKKTFDLIKEWYKISCNYHLLDDTPSIKPNYSIFVEHRHDQSIFSLLTKKYNIYSEESMHSAINILRNRTGISKIKPSK